MYVGQSRINFPPPCHPMKCTQYIYTMAKNVRSKAIMRGPAHIKNFHLSNYVVNKNI